jgi:hypothetical protein
VRVAVPSTTPALCSFGRPMDWSRLRRSEGSVEATVASYKALYCVVFRLSIASRMLLSPPSV